MDFVVERELGGGRDQGSEVEKSVLGEGAGTEPFAIPVCG